tara:strand:+ start:340 stop:543 length:204 start_codon:yes stop_codon:yes gene_type:complete
MWNEIMDMPGEIFDIERELESIAQAKKEREDCERFVEICFDLMAEGIVDEDAIEEEAHRIMDEEEEN